VHRSRGLDDDEGEEEKSHDRVVDRENPPPQKDHTGHQRPDRGRPAIRDPCNLQQHQPKARAAGDGGHRVSRWKDDLGGLHGVRRAEEKQRRQQSRHAPNDQWQHDHDEVGRRPARPMEDEKVLGIAQRRQTTDQIRRDDLEDDGILDIEIRKTARDDRERNDDE